MAAVPSGYVRVEHTEAEVVALASHAAAVREALAGGTLYQWAASHPERRVYSGRLPAYAAPLPGGGPRVVVRRAHHGGWLATVTGDLFFPPTRAPRELEVSQRLEQAGILTPEVVAYAVYPAGPLLRRSEVATREIAPAEDLGAGLLAARDPDARRALLRLAGELLVALTRAGAWHPDLNVKNILLAPDQYGVRRAYLLDVDRVRFVAPGDVAAARANWARLLRSARKWRARHGAGFDEAELGALCALASGRPEP